MMMRKEGRRERDGVFFEIHFFFVAKMGIERLLG